MKTVLAIVPLLLLALGLCGCVSGPPSGGGNSRGAHCLSRPDNSGTQPLIYLICIQTG